MSAGATATAITTVPASQHLDIAPAQPHTCGLRAAVPGILPPGPGVPRNSENDQEISKFGWGGPRANSGGSRPGAGRPPKPQEAATTPADPLQWRACATFGQAEISAARELNRQGYDTYVPLIAIRRRDAAVPTMWHIVRVPMLPGYVLIRLTQAQSREPVNATRGVRSLLRRPDGKLHTVPDRYIDGLRGDEDGRLQLPKERGLVLAIGTQVRIEAGPFESFPGKVLECDGITTCVSVAIFGRESPVWMSRADVAVVG